MIHVIRTLIVDRCPNPELKLKLEEGIMCSCCIFWRYINTHSYNKQVDAFW